MISLLLPRYYSEKFLGIEDEVALKCKNAGLEYIVVNGLEPESNRKVIELCERHPHLLPAAGIYPLNAACHHINAEDFHTTWGFEAPPKFDVDEEIEWIDRMCLERKIVAVGECGLDGHYLKDENAMLEQVSG